MVLQNEKCYIEISIDETYTLDSTDNRIYDVVLNPCNNKKGDFSKTFSTHTKLLESDLRIALIGPYYIYDSDCAVLKRDTLTILQDSIITQINIIDGTMIRHIELDCFGSNFAIYKIVKGYILYGELEITMLDRNLIKKWSFSGKNIFVSVSGKKPFEIKGNYIHLYDFENNYYKIDFEGKLVLE